jgi:hypothetical protein
MRLFENFSFWNCNGGTRGLIKIFYNLAKRRFFQIFLKNPLTLFFFFDKVKVLIHQVFGKYMERFSRNSSFWGIFLRLGEKAGFMPFFLGCFVRPAGFYKTFMIRKDIFWFQRRRFLRRAHRREFVTDAYN